MGHDKLQQWRYEEQQWEWNVINNQNNDFPNPYELAKEKGVFRRWCGAYEAHVWYSAH